MQERQAQKAALLLQYLRGSTVSLTITAAFVLSSPPVLLETNISQPEAKLTVQERVANLRKQINSLADGAAKRLVQSDDPTTVAQWDNWNNWRNS